MRRILKLLLIVILVGGAGYGAAKGFMYYRVKSALDNFAFQAGAHGSLRYGAIETDLRGRVTVNDVAFRPAASPDELVARRVHLTGPDALFFLDPRNDWSSPQSPPPPRLQLHVEGLELPLAPAADTPDAACRGTGLADFGLMQALDVARPAVDSEFGWELQSDGGLQAELGFDLAGIQSLRAVIRLDDVSAETLQGGGSPPQLRGFELRFHVDPAFGNKFALECARRRGITPDEFKAGLLAEQLREAETAGLTLGGGLRLALERFYTQWGEVRLVARPTSPVGMLSLLFLPPDRLAETLGLDLRVNDMVISDLGFAWHGGAGASVSLGALMGAEQPEAADAGPVRRPRIEIYWSDVAPNALAGHLGGNVRLYTPGQPPRVGILDAVRDGVAAVQQRVHGGHFTAMVPLAEISRAEVQLRRVALPEAAGGSASQQGKSEQAQAAQPEAARQ